jgi:Fe-S-cluster containining protein
MLLTDEDVLRLALRYADQPFWREDDGFLVLQTRDGPPAVGAPPAGPDGASPRPCWFLGDDGLCTVHDDRPAGCRLYPAIFDVDLRRPVLDDAECPHTDGFRLTRFTHDAVARLAQRLRDEAAARGRRAAGRGPTR